MTYDPQLRRDARDALVAALSIVEAVSETLTRDQLESAFRWAGTAGSKLNEAVCQVSGQSRKEERG